LKNKTAYRCGKGAKNLTVLYNKDILIKEMDRVDV